jgi:flagellar FliL protein
MAAAAEKTEQKQDAAPEAPKKSGGGGGAAKLVPILLLANSVLLAGVLALLLLRPGGLKQEPKGEHPDEHASAGEAHGKSEKAEKGGKGEKGKENMPGPTLRLADFVVHLRDADADRYLRVAFEVELADEKGKEALTARLPQVRDSFLAFLSDRSADELRGSENMSKVKTALAQRIGEIAPGAPLRGIYIADLVLQ